VHRDLAVIVLARDEAERLPATLAGLGCAFPGARIVVADDASGDDTAVIARGAGAEVVSSPRGLGKGGAATPWPSTPIAPGCASSRSLALEHRASGRDLRGFLHRGRQLVDVLRVARRAGGR
jgi:hypothetical protein